MARITELTLKGFKRQYVTEQLSGLDIFMGPNGVGKSARPEGLALAMLGYVPGRGKRAEDAMRLCAGDEVSVGLTLDNGFSFSRTFTRTTTRKRSGGVDVKISETLDVSPSKGEPNDTAKKARVNEEVGEFAIHLDFGEFLAMSAAKRREFLAGLVAGAGWGRERVESYLRDQMFPAGIDMLADDRTTVEGLLADCLAEWQPDLDVDAGVTAMLEWAKAQQTYWNSRKRDAQGAVRKLADLKNELGQTDRNIAQHKAALAELQEELINVERELAAGQEIKRQWEERQQRIAKLKASIEQAKDKAGPPDVADLAAKVEAARGRIVECSVDTTESDAQEESLRQELRQVQKALDEARRTAASIEGRMEAPKRAIETASSTGGLCVIDKLIRCPKDFSGYLDHMSGMLQQLQQELAVARQAIAQHEKRQAEIEAEIASLQKERFAKLRQVESQQKANEAARKVIAAAEAEIAERDRQARLLTDRFNAMQQELAEIEATPVRAVPELDVLTKHAEGLRAQQAELTAKVEEQEKARITLSNMQVSMIDSNDAEFKHVTVKHLADVLGPKGIQGELLKGGLEPLREVVQANLDVLDVKAQFAFRTESDRGQEIFEFGWLVDGDLVEEAFVSFDALSTGQQLMTLAAIITALLEEAKPPVKVLCVDNIENLDAVNQRRTLTGLAELQRIGKLDNVLVAGKIDGSPEDEWVVHQVGVVAEVVTAA